MEYIPSIINPIAHITPLKQEFRVPLSFLHMKMGRSTLALIYSCLYDSAIPVATPYIYTTRLTLEKHMDINRDTIKTYLMLLANNDVMFIERNGRANEKHVRNRLENDMGIVYRILCKVKPKRTHTLIPYIIYNTRHMNEKDKCTRIVLSYLNGVSNLLGIKTWEQPVEQISDDLHIHQKNVRNALAKLDSESKIKWRRSKGRGCSAVEFIGVT